mmetsp:Transcript_41154/g.66720  ORF Transcript_41154/g.66720 Transcript_41154/m.66720 type:complete len:888 (+) Transcript_41154:243-2906(+)|eukprot:CAMPEP_0184665094 /NCGR_PEP_ID=MMETSP0308-20130426/55601_1 /TAXON_ID=38269 /ORGANISM="Gloeochaete witrockiana, Strain SAG 46.84" /LENGTH=887 /DNA_ID=CAMNT_0027108873 /DNA_START=242 /DNA_END=2905 /DNA_ORIENTATION=-
MSNASGILRATLIALAVSFVLAGPLRLQVLHTNDIHGRFDEFSVSGNDNINCATNPCYGGFARIKTAIDAAKAASSDPSIYVDAGDISTGTLFYSYYGPASAAKYFNLLQPDAVAIGNHEFDQGPAGAAKFMYNVTFPILAANIDASAEPLLNPAPWVPYTIKTINGEQVGIIGVTTLETAVTSSPGPNIVFTDPTAAVQAQVNALKALGVNKIIALTHIGYPDDVQLCQSVAGLDLIVGGHSHTMLYNPTVTTLGTSGTLYFDFDPQFGSYPTILSNADGPCVVFQDYYTGKYLGNFVAEWDTAGVLTSSILTAYQSFTYLPKILRSTTFNYSTQASSAAVASSPLLIKTAKDSAIDAIIAADNAPLTAYKSQVVGRTLVAMPQSNAIVRAQEAILGNAVTDGLVWYVNNVLGAGLQAIFNANGGCFITITNGGGLRTSIPAGNITVGGVIGVLPFKNLLVVLNISGADIITALENGVSQYIPPNQSGQAGRFPQVSGLRFTFNPSAPAFSRIREVNVTKNGVTYPIELTKRYFVITNDFMHGGGDGYSVFTNKQLLVDKNNAIDMAEAFIEYIEANSPLNPKLEGRIATTTTTVAGPFGDPHIVSFDGMVITYYNDGDYTLAEVPTKGLKYQARFCGREGNLASYTCAIALQCSSDAEPLQFISASSDELDPIVLVSGEAIPAVAVGDYRRVGKSFGLQTLVTRIHADRYRISCFDDTFTLDVRVRRMHETRWQFMDVSTTAHASVYAGKIHGLLGTMDGEHLNDFSERAKTTSALHTIPTHHEMYRNVFDDPALEEFEKKWRLSPEQSLFSTAPNAKRVSARHLLSTGEHPWTHTESRTDALEQCRKMGLSGPFLYTCAFDLVATGDASAVKYSMERAEMNTAN